MGSWTLFFAAIGLAMVLEGLPYFVSPRFVRNYLRLLERSSDATLRALGFVMIALGLLIAFVSTR